MASKQRRTLCSGIDKRRKFSDAVDADLECWERACSYPWPERPHAKHPRLGVAGSCGQTAADERRLDVYCNSTAWRTEVGMSAWSVCRDKRVACVESCIPSMTYCLAAGEDQGMSHACKRDSLSQMLVAMSSVETWRRDRIAMKRAS